MANLNRRTYLAAVATAAVAGCTQSTSGGVDSAAGAVNDNDDDATPTTTDQPNPTGPPTTDRLLPLPDETTTLADSIVSGGVPKDGIPSIDEPEFLTPREADEWLDDEEPVFGVVRNGAVRAYPQRVLVWHEIVNDELGDENLAITYCPLTGTAQGFERGETEFGVSGKLLNSNLVMYDRATDSYWPQMLATAIRGEYEGSVLREFPVTWTSWERWREAQPETIVLSDDTGFARDYSNDPYGSYAPPSGFYASDRLMFEPYTEVDESLHPKSVVLGARSADGALAVEKEALAEAGVLEGDVGGVPHVAVFDQALETGYIYRNESAASVTLEDGSAVMDGTSYHPGELPLERVLRYDAFWFAWNGYYPDTELLQ